MNIIHIYGGLGNQMFQYAFYLYMKSIELDTYITTDYFLNNWNKANHGTKFLLPLVFKYIDAKIFSNFDTKIMYSPKPTWTILRSFRKIRKNSKHIRDTYDFVTKKNLNINQRKISNHSLHFIDYWQDVEFVLSIENEIRKAFIFDDTIFSEKNNQCINKISNTNSVALHVRRGDYLNHSNIYGNICTLNYYNKAISIIEERIDSPYYYIFSDDIEWCEKQFKNLNQKSFINWNSENAHFDMLLMSKCKHNIIANSSFSWWGSWLNNNINKIVVMPKNWTSLKKSNHLVFQNCISI